MKRGFASMSIAWLGLAILALLCGASVGQDEGLVATDPDPGLIPTATLGDDSSGATFVTGPRNSSAPVALSSASGSGAIVINAPPRAVVVSDAPTVAPTPPTPVVTPAPPTPTTAPAPPNPVVASPPPAAPAVSPPPAAASPPPAAPAASPPPAAPPATSPPPPRPRSPSPPPGTAALPPPPSPPPPAASNAPAEKTALQVTFLVQGPGVSPFNVTKQELLLNALANVISTVPKTSMRIYQVVEPGSRRRTLLWQEGTDAETVVWADEGVNAAGPRRALLASNTAYVTVEMDAGSVAATDAVRDEVKLVTDGGILATALQALGQPLWGITANTYSFVVPGQIVCRSKYGKFCLDGSGLSVAGVKGIIAGGIIFIILVATGSCFAYDTWRRSGSMEMAEGPPPLVTSNTEEQQTLYKRILRAMNSPSASPKAGVKAAAGSTSASGKRGKDDPPNTVHMTAAPAVGSPVAEQILSLTYGMGGAVPPANAPADAAGDPPLPPTLSADAPPASAGAEGLAAKGDAATPAEDAPPAADVVPPAGGASVRRRTTQDKVTAAPAQGDARKRVAAAMRKTNEGETPAAPPATETKTVTKFVRRRTGDGAARKTDDGAPGGAEPPTDA